MQQSEKVSEEIIQFFYCLPIVVFDVGLDSVKNFLYNTKQYRIFETALGKNFQYSFLKYFREKSCENLLNY